MNGIVLDRAELISLLDRLQVDRLIGVEPELLPQPTNEDRQGMIQGGVMLLPLGDCLQLKVRK